MTNDVPATSDTNWKMQTYLIGGLAGLALGVLTAYFFARVSEENGDAGPTRLKTMDTLKLAVAVLGIMRQITDMGASSKK